MENDNEVLTILFFALFCLLFITELVFTLVSNCTIYMQVHSRAVLILELDVSPYGVGEMCHLKAH